MGSNSEQYASKTCLSIVIVGAGIAGLTAATSIAQKGHQVTVLESHPKLNEFGASINIAPNGIRVLKAFGFKSNFERVATNPEFMIIRDGLTNESLGQLAQNYKNHHEVLYGEPDWDMNRADFQEVLAHAAEASGARIVFDAAAKTVDVDNCRIVLQDGRELTADVIVGADGLRSIVRRSIKATADVEPKALVEQCFRCTVPVEKMKDSPQLRELLERHNMMVWTTPGKYVLSWNMPEGRPYDVVANVIRESDVPPGKWGTRVDPAEMRKHFEDFCPQARELLSHVDASVKWTLAELPPLKTCRSDNGKVILIGDAYHGMIPHSASGGNSAIEDGATLGECLDWAYKNKQDVSEATAAFEHLRKDRVERMQRASHEGYGFLSASVEFKPIRDRVLAQQTQAQAAQLARPESERRADVKTKADMNARFPSEPYYQWLFGHDAIAVAQEYLSSKLKGA